MVPGRLECARCERALSSAPGPLDGSSPGDRGGLALTIGMLTATSRSASADHSGMDAHAVPLVTPTPDDLTLDCAPRLDALAHAGRLVRVRRGVYVEPDAWVADDVDRIATLSARAAQVRATQRLVFSHLTAARLLGLPLVGVRDKRLHTIDMEGSGRRSRHGIAWHGTTRPALVERDTVHGLSVTSARQTALDLARSASAVTAFIVADAVAHAADDMAALLEWWAGRLDELGPVRGCRRASRVFALVTGRSESPLESLSLLRMHELGFEPPEQQFELQTRRGLFRLDFAWAGGEIAGEADGRAKYGGLESTALMEERLWKEKLRHDAVREHLRAYPRWNWDDAWFGQGLERELSTARVPRPRRAMRLSF